MIYLDNNSTTVVDPKVRDEMLNCFERSFGNPSSAHAAGQVARRLLEKSRQQVAGLIKSRPGEVVFTSGGTEANNLAILGLAAQNPQKRHILISAIEHQSVLNPCRYLEKNGFELTLLKVEKDGRVNPTAVAQALRDDTLLVSVMLANNETGVIQPLPQIAALTRQRGVKLHIDAVQAAGKIAVNVAEIGADTLSISAHKIFGPKGIGALYLREGIELTPTIFGGSQERGLRPGTENVAGIVGFGKACELAGEFLEESKNRVQELREHFEKEISMMLKNIKINGAQALRLPNTSSVTFPEIDAEMLAINLDLLGVAVSTGSACSTVKKQPSHVLLAMGLSPAEALSTLRFSFCKNNTANEIETVLIKIRAALTSLKGPNL